MCKHDRQYLQLASLWAQNSYALKRQVGALIVRDRRIISDGYNGALPGFENKCEDEDGWGRLITRPEVVHAEANALLKLAKARETSEGATMYVTIPPCIECAKLIIQAGIIRVVYAQPHKIAGLTLLNQANVITKLLLL